MIISLIVAMDENNGIGKAGALPWRLSDDLKRFKALTMGHAMLMGRKTYDSIGRPLPGRTTYVVSRNLASIAGLAGQYPDGALYGCGSIEAALEAIEASGESEVFIIGGGEIFTQALPLADRVYLTRVQAKLGCDTFFPEIDLDEWQVVEETEHSADEKNEYPTTYQALVHGKERK